MTIRRIASPTETEGISTLIQEGEYRKAVSCVLADLGADLSEYCLAMLDDQTLAEQATIATLADMYAAMPGLGNTALRPWLFGQARSTCIALQEELASPPKTYPALPGGDPNSPSRQQMLLRKALWKLDADERDAGLLRYLARLDYEDVGRICGMDTAAARKKAGKALLRLRQVVRGHGASTGSTVPKRPAGARG